MVPETARENDPVAAAFHAVPRTGFLPGESRARAGFDGPIPIGHGQTNSQPRTVLAMLRLLAVRRGDRVLDVGAGSGWSTALLAELTGPDGSVLGLELEPDLARWGAGNVAAAGLPWARLEAADPQILGAPGGAPFDRILVSAEAAEIPEELVAQLAGDGRMVAPVRGEMTRVVLHGGHRAVSTHGRYRFVPLRTARK